MPVKVTGRQGDQEKPRNARPYPLNNVAMLLSFWMSLPVNSWFTENTVHN
jgi:hypothetical protein